MRATQQPPVTDPTAEKPSRGKRWYMRPWVWVIAAVLIVGGIGNALGGGESSDPAAPHAAESPASAVVPELSGVAGDEARSQLDALGLTTKVVADDGSGVLAPSNWEVQSVDPAPGETVSAGSTVTLTVTKSLQTVELTQTEIDGIAQGVFEGRPVTITGGKSTKLPATLIAQAPLPAKQFVVITFDGASGVEHALFATGEAGDAVAGPIIGLNDAATVNFRWGTAATPDSPVGQFITEARADPTAAKLIAQAQKSEG